MTADPHANAAILAAADARGWFAAEKVEPVWARELDEDTVVETREGPLQASKGDYLCRARGGGSWPQTETSLRRKYEPTDETDDEGFRKWVPNPANARVLASQLLDETVLVTSWGPMNGEAGDFLVKRAMQDDAGTVDCWIVDKATFEAWYERQEEETEHGE